ncbi:siderophore-interacting protein [Nocardioides sp. Kera G14]|uniref:siderophore-interacting protein n=1 Tax=Nocardioides sp. Kera G14 TaxID=2884264 RepID=UPI001D100BE6|nr:siderophore-interacting protein [Nocardioides sp. Kera G14]UDY23221.1 siderophore-interacting protein [Nocardioides sp. Kera G14]
MLLTRLAVTEITRPSPSFARIVLGGPELADFGVDGPLFDQRIKLLFPGPAGLPELRPESWWTDFTALPEETRGWVRTYTIADVLGSDEETRIVVDFVLHPGAHGPGSGWALAAEAGDELLAVVPRRGTPMGGIEFAPGGATRVLLIGDETALPAIVQILRELPAGMAGSVFIEVPLDGDCVELPRVPEVEVTWLPRNGAPIGELVVEAVGAHLGFAATPEEVVGLEVDPDLWETPVHSSSGEELVSEPVDDRYAWIAGESSLVARLRRHLVGELGLPRAQVAFMGYWREGVAMRG